MSTHALLSTIELTVVSDGDGRTAFFATVYEKNRNLFKENEVVGSLTDTIGGVLAKSKNGGTKNLCMTMSCFINTISSNQSVRNASWRRHF